MRCGAQMAMAMDSVPPDLDGGRAKATCNWRNEMDGNQVFGVVFSSIHGVREKATCRESKQQLRRSIASHRIFALRL